MKTSALIVLIVIAAGVLMALPRFIGNSTPSALSEDINMQKDHIKGSADAPITLVEYSDFQCPACAAYYPTVKAISENLEGQVRFVYRHFPLSQVHPRAEIAGRAAEAAGVQGKFFEMHDVLFENQDEWSRGGEPAIDYFTTYAGVLGLNIEQFQADINSDALKNKVLEDYGSGLSSNVNSTPTFFLNGQKLNINHPEGLVSEIQNALNTPSQENN